MVWWMAGQPFPTDLTDDQWQQVAQLLSASAALGRPRKLDLREVVNAILYLLHFDCGWRGLPARFPNRSSVRTYYDRWRQDGTWPSICKVLGIPVSSSVRRGRKSRKKDAS
jgi:putative transposase